MNFRTTYVLIGIVVLALAGLGIYVATTGDKKTAPSAEGYVLQSLRAANSKTDEVTNLDIERPGQTPDHISFARDGKLWKMIAPSRARIDSAAVDSIVSSLLNAKTEKSADIAGNLGAHGLDNPPVKVTLTAGSTTETVSLGNVTIGGDKAVVYVTTSDQPDRPQAARRTDFAPLFKADVKNATNAGQLVKSVSDFRPLKLIGEGLFDAANQVNSFAVRAGKDEMALFRAPPDNAWRFRVPAGYGEAASEAPPPNPTGKEPGGVNSVPQLLNTIMNIQPAGRDKIIENPKDLATYGLDPTKNAPLQIDFTRSDGVQETIYVSGPVKQEGKPDKYYARNEADSSVAEVPADPVQKVHAALANKNLLRDRSVLKLVSTAVDAIDVVANGDTFALRKSGPTWKVYEGDAPGRLARSAAVMELLTRLTTRQLATGFPPPGEPDNKVGFAPPVAELRIWVGGIVKDEKPDPNARPKVLPTPTTRVLFGHKAQGDVVYCRRATGDPKAETKADYFVPADVFVLATRGHLDYLDASIRPFAPDSVLKLSFTHGKEVFELERPDEKKPVAQAAWKINAPERLKGRAADPLKVSGLVTSLSFLQPVKVAADKLTPDVLNRLEVNPDSARLRATVSTKDQPDRSFYFGGDVGTAKQEVYLKPSDQDLVFEVPRGTFDEFQKADVQDTVVHRIDKAKIKEVMITGWQEVLGSPTTLDIERKDGKWTLKSGGKFEVDPKKVDAFLDTLTAPRADAFVVYKTGPKPEHNLDVAKNALKIEMVMDMGEPVTMVISPPNKDGKVFATSSLSPGDVFTMADQFAAIRAKPAALKKD
jgi:hypothetical protein